MKFRLMLRPNAPLNKRGEASVVIACSSKGAVRYLFMGIEMKPDHWQDVEGNYVRKEYGPSYVVMNAALNQKLDLAKKLRDTYLLEHGRYPEWEAMKLMWQGGATQTATPDLFNMWDKWFEYRKNKAGSESMSLTTLKGDQTTKMRLVEFQREEKVLTTFNSLNIQWVDQFKAFMNRKGYAVNSIGTSIKKIRTFLRWVEAYHSIKVHPSVLTALTAPSEQNAYLFLHESELDLIANADLPDSNPSWEKVRDAWLFQARTGFRISDLKLIGKNISVVDGQHIITVTTKKNGAKVSFPLHKEAVRILKKYEGQDVKSWIPPDQKINEKIKLIARHAGLTRPWVKSRGKGEARKDTEMQIWQGITTHTARRTFINNALRKGLTAIDIASITGQHVQTITNSYMQADSITAAKAMKQLGG